MKTALWCYRSSTYKSLNIWFWLLLIIINDPRHSNEYNIFGAEALRVRGEFDLSQDFFLFLAKFGFQKTDIQDPNNTQGVIYGNISLALIQNENMDALTDNETIYNHDHNTGKINRYLYLLPKFSK